VNGFRRCAIAALFLLGLPGFANATSQKPTALPPWVSDLNIPQNESMVLVVKGVFGSRREAENLVAFIQQLMGTTPGDGVDVSDIYSGLPKGKFIVGMLFDDKERAKWWMDFSYRNRKISKGTIYELSIAGQSRLPYMPAATRAGQKRLLSETEALARVKALPDVQQLGQVKKLVYRFTDYPRNGDLRYEIEVLEDRGRGDPRMVDFVLVSALTGDITERYSTALGRPHFAKD
jgi:hypothetical protein